MSASVGFHHKDDMASNVASICIRGERKRIQDVPLYEIPHFLNTVLLYYTFHERAMCESERVQVNVDAGGAGVDCLPPKYPCNPSFRNADGRVVFVYHKATLFKTLLARRQEF